MRYLSFIRDDVILWQMKTSLTDDECIDLSEGLRALGCLETNEELAITERYSP